MTIASTEGVQGTILIADDDPISRNMLKLLLQKDGYQIHEQRMASLHWNCMNHCSRI